MIKKQLLTLTFAALALNAAAQPLAAGNKNLPSSAVRNSFNIQNVNKADASRFFLTDMLGEANLKNKLQNAYYLSKNNAAVSRACDNVTSENIDKTLISKIKSFNLQEECKKVKPDTPIEKIDYSKIRPHVHKRKLLRAIRSEIKASDEIAAKKDILAQIHNNLRSIAGQAVLSGNTEYKRDLLCLVDRALYAVKKTDYISALEITKQAVKK